MLVKKAILTKSIYFNGIPFKTLTAFFAEIDKLVQKFIRSCKGPRIAKTICKRRTKLKESHFLISKLTAKLQ